MELGTGKPLELGTTKELDTVGENAFACADFAAENRLSSFHWLVKCFLL